MMHVTSTAPPHHSTAENGGGTAGFFTVVTGSTPDAKLQNTRLLWEKRRIFARTAVYGLLLSTLTAVLIPNRYKATTQLMPPEGQQGLGMALLSALSTKGGAALGGMANDLLGMKNSGALFVGVLKSRTVADQLIGQFQLQRVYHDSKMEDAREDLADHTDIAEDRKSGILTIAVTDHDPRRAQAMAQAYVEQLDRLVAQVSTSSARRERIFLEGRLQEVKTDLDAAANRFGQFASKNTAIDIPAQSKAMVEAAATLQGQMIAAQSELSGLEQIYTANNVRVRAMKARVAELRRQLDKLGGDSTNAGSDSSLYPPIRKLPLLGVTYADLYRNTKIQETVFELLTQQYEMAKVQEAKEIPTVKVLDAAILPTKKSFPPRLAIILGGTFLVQFAVGFWLIYRKRWEETNSDDPRRKFAEEVGTSIRGFAVGLRPISVKAGSRNGENGERQSLTDEEEE